MRKYLIWLLHKVLLTSRLTFEIYHFLQSLTMPILRSLCHILCRQNNFEYFKKNIEPSYPMTRNGA